jgi:hypothetical protein
LTQQTNGFPQKALVTENWISVEISTQIVLLCLITKRVAEFSFSGFCLVSHSLAAPTSVAGFDLFLLVYGLDFLGLSPLD